MANIESNKELLLSRNNNDKSNNGFFRYSIILKWILKITLWIFFIFWVFVIFMYPLQSSESFVRKWTSFTSSFIGSALLIFSGPIIVISVLYVLHIVLDSVQDDLQEESIAEKEPKYRLRTFPVIVRGPFGVISASEIIVMMVFALYLIWVASIYALQKLAGIFANPQYTTTQQKWSEFVKECGKGCGVAGLVCISFMMITVTRGSTVVKLLNIQPQDAIRYHIWVSHLSLFLFTFHGFLYLFGWFLIGGIPSKMILWQSKEVAHLPGIINILISWIIWITSIPSIRLKYFELFYYTHYLHILFILFLALHIGNFFFSIVAGPIFLFMMDYFFRLFQSRKHVDAISTTSFSCDVVELVMPIAQNLKHNALSYIFVRVKEISPIQWHPFSVTTTPLDGKSRIAVLVKASGNWTSQLKDKVLNHPTKLNASIEGPYGYDAPNYLRCKYLILVAGGIGISPFIALLSDVKNRIKLGKPCRPTNIILIWTMKRSNNLSLLSTIDMENMSNSFHELKDFQIMIYVTQELQPQPDNIMLENPIISSVYSSSNKYLISDVANSGHKIWFATYIISSTIGFIVIISALNILYIRPFEITNWGFQAILLLACMAASVSIFGGSVIGLQNILEKKKFSEVAIDEEQSNEYVQNSNSFLEHFSRSMAIHYGSRPDFKEIFGSIENRWGHADVNVIVCGPKSLEESVATECRSLNFARRSNQPIFHFTCHSFNF